MNTRSQSGFSYIEILVSLVVLVLSGTVLASHTTWVSRSMRLSTHKIEVTKLRNEIDRNFSSDDACWQIRGRNLDTTALNTAEIELPTLHVGSETSSLLAATAGQPLNALDQSGLVVESIKFAQFETTGTPNLYQGTLNIEIRSPLGSIKPVQFTKLIETDSAGVILGCQGGSVSFERICQSLNLPYNSATNTCVPRKQFVLSHTVGPGPNWAANAGPAPPCENGAPVGDYDIVSSQCYINNANGSCYARLCLFRLR